ncbi:MAG TPA: O-antigen ligase family protein [Terriglobales bacterium]|nr:O-antigen ligase family protein [Terriglobales bacterium]
MYLHSLIKWWERGVFAALFLSIALLGVGRLEFGSPSQGMSAWSVSRTTFFFWLILQVLLWVQRGRFEPGFVHLRTLAQLYAFFAVVTLSLLPDFHAAGDYRYFTLACVHAVVVVDVFSEPRRQTCLLYLLGIVPIVLVVRGLVHNPLVLSFDLTHRFGFPLDHPNTAGFLFSMSIPLGLAAATTGAYPWRVFGWLSLAAQGSALVLTFSRGAWLGWSASMLFLSGASKKRQLSVGVLAVIAIVMVAVPSLRQRIVTTITNPETDPSIGDRLQVFREAFKVGLKRPVIGAGYGRGRLREALHGDLPAAADFNPAHTHNVYLELFAETGILGLGTFLWLLWNTLRRVWCAAATRALGERTIGFAIAASWCAAIVAGLGDVPFFHHESRIFFFTLFAWACLYSEKYRSTASG